MKQKYKIGDKLICIGNSTGYNDNDPNCGGGGWKKELTGTVVRISNNDYYNKGPIYWFSEFPSGIFEKFLSYEIDKRTTKELNKICLEKKYDKQNKETNKKK